jgi:hypothetical protein
VLRSAPPVRSVWTILVTTLWVANAIHVPTPVTQPLFDLDDLGRMGLVGDFGGISLYQYTGPSDTSLLSNGSDRLMFQLPNGLFTSLALADSTITAMCVYESKDGTQKGIVVGGGFTSLGGVEANGIALYDPDNNSVTPMGDFAGKVNALLCDKDTNRVYVGGTFSLQKSENAIAWEDGSWESLPFQGFTDPVNTITKSNNNSVIFGGSFNALMNFSKPSVKNAQTLNIGSADITATQTTDISGFSDPKAITCTNGTEKQWLLKDGQQGSWTAQFRLEFFPTKLRLINSDYQGRATTQFRFTAFPINGIMNLTYTDPKTKKRKACDAFCPLAVTDQPQDFEFINVIGMSSFRLDIYKWEGAGGGLSSVQLFQDQIMTYAIPDLNEPTCAAATTRSNSSTKGKWKVESETTVDSDFLNASIGHSELNSQIVFEPHIQQSGRYQVLMYTPGCISDNSCSTRGEVQVTGVVTKDGKEIPPYSFFQTNDFNKYDVVYDSQVDAVDGSFRPRITLSPAPTQTASVVDIVAQKVQFRLVGNADSGSEDSNNDSSSSSGELNGLYEYRTNDKKPTNPSDSKITTAGLDLEKRASVAAVIVQDDLTYVGGNFTDKGNQFQNFFIIDKNGPVQKVAEGGLEGPVTAMLLVNDLIYVGGSFSGTKAGSTDGVSNICAYDTKAQSWVALGAGVNGPVADVVSVSLNLTSGVEDCIAVSGSFTEIQVDSNKADDVDVTGFAVWVPSKKQWLEAMDSEEISLTGVISAVAQSGSDTVYAGSVASNSLSASGAVFVSGDNGLQIQASTLKIIPSVKSSSSRKRDVAAQNLTGVITGIFYVAGGKNLTILGGQFEAKGNGSTIHNLAFIDGASGDISGASNEFDAQSTILALHTVGSLLFIGGSLQGTKNMGGVAVWDLDKMALADSQPQALSGGSAVVRAISSRPDTQDVYVAGDFGTAGSLDCANLCIYQNSRQQWVEAASETPGIINVLHWVDKNSLIVGGDMNFNNTKTYLATFDAKAGSFVAFGGNVDKLPGPVTGIAVDSDSSDALFISGTGSDGAPYLMKFQQESFTELGKWSLIFAIGHP